MNEKRPAPMRTDLDAMETDNLLTCRHQDTIRPPTDNRTYVRLNASWVAGTVSYRHGNEKATTDFAMSSRVARKVKNLPTTPKRKPPVFVTADTIEMKPTPWRGYPHCLACRRRVVSCDPVGTYRASKRRTYPTSFDGNDCPWCGESLDRSDTEQRIEAEAQRIFAARLAEQKAKR